MTGWTRHTPGTRKLWVGPARLAFDGNKTDDMKFWWFPGDLLIEQTETAMQELIDATANDGHLSWAVFPPEGFRL